MKLYKLVLTGGPCAGKSTGLSRVAETLTGLGYRVLTVPEAATELGLAGVTFDACRDAYLFQKNIFWKQLQNEAVYEAAAETLTQNEKVVLLCDRGIMDGKAYMQKEDFSRLAAEFDKDELQLRDGYDAIFHLVSTATDAPQFYTTANNAIRRESVEEAAALDRRIVSAWAGHPHLRLIDNSTSFEEKIRRLVGEITAFLGEPEPLEIERKYLIEYPDTALLDSLENCSKVEIIQTYLRAPEGCEKRIRQRGQNGSYIYTMTTKTAIDGLKRIETEERISDAEYLRLLMEADPQRRPIRKTRYCLMHRNTYLEIDLYPFWQDQAILEIELSNEAAAVAPEDLPDFIHILKEVTEDEQFKNAALAKQF